MSLPLIVSDESSADIAEAALWYEGRSLGLGAEFVRRVDACFSLSRNPEMFSVVQQLEMVGLYRFAIQQYANCIGQFGPLVPHDQAVAAVERLRKEHPEVF